MSRTVDERVVEMRFNNAQFEKNAQTSIKTLDKLKESSSFQGASKGLDAVGKSMKKLDMNGLGNAVESVSKRFSAMEVMAVTALANITNSVVNAGKQMLNSFTVEPITQGFSEYELKMNSVQTIMASTGADINTVNKYLNELNTYADKTIYSFSDMTENIGKFTNAGVKLDDAVKAIQGISNEAAVSGANANEASRAMYNFAQALSAGSVKLIDWKSIENANMATVEFKQALIDTAVEMGTVVKVGEQYQSTTTDNRGSVSDLFDATKNFNDALSSQWMTTDVLVKTLGEYADETTELGKKAFAAAQDVKTFTQLLDTLKEAVGSGWAMSFELIFGDKEEAKELWTGVSNVLGSAIDGFSDARNKILKSWKKRGGRDDMIDSVTNAFQGLLSVLNPVREAYRDVFPPMTGKRLAEITKSLKEFTSHMKLGGKDAKNLHDTFQGIFSALSIGKQAISGLLTAITPAGSILGNLGSGLLEVTGSIGRWLVALDEAAKKNQAFEKIASTVSEKLERLKTMFSDSSKAVGEFADNFFGKFAGLPKVAEGFHPLEAIGNVLSGFVEKLSGLSEEFPSLKQIGSIVGTALGKIGEAIGKFFQNADFDTMVSLLDSGIFLYIAENLHGMFSELKDAGGILDNIKELLGGASDALEEFQKSIQVQNLQKIAVAIAILAGSLFVLSTIDSEKLGSALIGVTGLMVNLIGAVAALDKIGGVDGLGKTTSGMIGLSVAILILSVAMKKLSDIKPDELARGLLAIGVMMGELVAVSVVMEKSGSQMVKGSLGLILFAAALTVMAKAVGTLGSMDIPTLQKGLVSLGVIMGEVAAFSRLIKPDKLLFTGIAMLAIGGALNIMADSVKKIGELPIETIKTGLVTIGSLLGEIGLFSRLADSNGMVATGVGMLGIAASMEILADVMGKIGSLDLEVIGKGLLGIGGVLAEIGVFVKLVPASDLMMTAPALVVMATGIKALGKALAGMGNMSWKQLATGLVALGGSLAILAVGAYAMSGALPGAAAMLVMSVALAAFVPPLMALSKMSLPQVGIALLALAGSITAIGVASVLLTPAVPAILAIAGALLMLGVAVTALGAGMALMTVSDGLDAMNASMRDVFGVTMTKLFETFLKSFKEVIKTLITFIPDVVTALAEAVIEFAVVLGNGAADIADAGIKIVSAFLRAIGTLFPQLVNTGIGMLLALLDGLGQNMGQIVDKATLVITEFLNGIARNIPKIVDAGWNVVVAFVTAIGDRALQALGAGSGLATKALEGIKQQISGFVDAGKNAVTGFINGLLSLPGKLISAGAELGKKALEAAKKALDINSPSKEFEKIGIYSVEGYTGGFKKQSKKAQKEVSEALLKVLDDSAKSIKSNSLKDALKLMGGNMAESLKSGLESELQNDSVAKAAAKSIKKYQNQIQKLKKEKKSAEHVLSSKSSGKKEKTSAKTEIKDADKEITKLEEKIRQEKDKIAKESTSIVKRLTAESLKETKALYRGLKSETDAIDKNVTQTVVKIPEAVSTYIQKNQSAVEYAKGSVKAFEKSFGSVASKASIESGKRIRNYKKQLEDLEKKQKSYENTVNDTKASNAERAKAKKQLAETKKQISKITKDLEKERSKADLTTASGVISAFADSLYKESDSYKQTKANLKAYSKELAKLEKKQKIYKEASKNLSELKKQQKELEAITSDQNATKEQKAKAQQALKTVKQQVSNAEKAKNSLKDVEKQIKSTTKNVTKETKNLATGAEKAFKEFRKSIKTAVKEYMKLSNLSFDKMLSGFDKFERGSSLVENATSKWDFFSVTISESLSEASEAFDVFNMDISEALSETAEAFDIFNASMDTGINLLENFTKTGTAEVEALFERSQSQLDAYEEFQNGLEKMESMGFDTDLVDELASQGPSSLNYIRGFLNMTGNEVDRYNQQIQKKNGYQAKALARSMQKQLAQYTEWTKDIESLAARGLSEGILNKLKEAGVGQAEYVKALTNMDSASLANVADIYKQSVITAVSDGNQEAVTSFLDGIRKNVSEYEQWNEQLAELATKGLSSTIIERFREMGLDQTKDYIASILKESYEGIQEINELYSKSLTVGVNVDGSNTGESVFSFLEGVRKNAADYAKWNEELTELATKGLSSTIIERFREMGLDQTKDYIASILKESYEGIQEINELYLKSMNQGRTPVQVLTDNLQSQLDGLSGYNKDLQTLASRFSDGVNNILYKQLEAMGLEGAEYIHAAAEATDSELQRMLDIVNAREKANEEERTKNLQEQLKKRVEVTKQWAKDLATLSDWGITETMMSELKELGPEGAEQVRAMVEMGRVEFRNFASEYTNALKLSDTVANSVAASYATAATGAANAWNEGLNATLDALPSQLAVTAAAGVKLLGDKAKEQTEILSGDLGVVVTNVLSDKSFSTSMKTAGSVLAAALGTGVISKKDEVKTKSTNVAKAGVDGAKTQMNSTKGNTIGKTFMTGIGSGLESQKASIVSIAVSVGQAVGDGMAQGIRSRQSAVTSAISAMTSAATSMAQANLAIHSPSRVFERFGAYTDEGFAKGIRNNVGQVTGSVEDMANNAIFTMQAVIAQIVRAVNGEIEAEPVIRPVLDLSVVRRNAQQIQSVLEAGRLAAVIDSGSGSVAESGGMTFIQNNYSPKSLSRLDIYRQTKNQFAMAKGMVT